MFAGCQTENKQLPATKKKQNCNKSLNIWTWKFLCKISREKEREKKKEKTYRLSVQSELNATVQKRRRRKRNEKKIQIFKHNLQINTDHSTMTIRDLQFGSLVAAFFLLLRIQYVSSIFFFKSTFHLGLSFIFKLQVRQKSWERKIRREQNQHTMSSTFNLNSA